MVAGRPNKATVDYFPHYCTHGKTLFIIEQQFGNDGYAFWFKLLEYLGKSDGHKLDYKDADVSEYLQAITKTDDNLCMQILDKLAKLGAIDRQLWDVDKLIWSDNFVENIKDAYKRRKDKLPQKPVSSVINVSINSINVDNNSPKQPNKRNSAGNNRERERESKEKGKEIEKGNNISPDEPAAEISGKAFLTDVHFIVQEYNDILGGTLPRVEQITQKRIDKIKALFKKNYTLDKFVSAFKITKASDFLCGRTKDPWTGCGFDWIINEANLVKILEGNYNNRGHGSPGGLSPAMAGLMDIINGEGGDLQ